jgi:glycosyltransferase involved in cell wall biosynthesis
LAPLALAGSAFQLLRVLRFGRLVGDLGRVAPRGDFREANLPGLTVVVPARNEAAALRGALPTLLGQDYPGLRIVVVDDRSTDGTARVIESAAAGRYGPVAPDGPVVEALGVSALPEGWTGKTHALHLGALRSTGDWLLFTDADVRFDPTALRRAVGYAESEALDHLTLVPKLDLDGYFLQGVAAFFYLGFMIHLGMYRANSPGSRVGVGVGAFNLLRRDAYRAIGTLGALPLAAADDVSLGRAVKRRGLKQRVLTGLGSAQDPPLLRVRWYESLGGFLRGVEKNVLPVCGYDPSKVLGLVLLVQISCVLPFAAPLFPAVRASRAALFAYALAAAMSCLSFARFGRHQRHPNPRLLGLGYPFFALLSSYALLRAAAVVLRDGGITWRGTFYSLKALREAEKRERQAGSSRPHA